MKVSVVIPFFNCKKYIIECLYSVKNQSFSDFEIVLVNDGSTDGTDAIVSEWMRINEGIRITYIDQYNQGVSSARNAGLECSQGEYVFF